MARRSDPPPGAPRLTVPPRQLAAELDERVAVGEALLARPISSREELTGVQADYYAWDEYNRLEPRSGFESNTWKTKSKQRVTEQRVES